MIKSDKIPYNHTSYMRNWSRSHPEKIKEYKERFEKKHGKEYIKLRAKKWQVSHLTEIRVRSKKWRINHPIKIKESQLRCRRNLRIIVLSAYGGKCDCCGEVRYEFLAIDHINGGGNKHRRQLTRTKKDNGGSQNLYFWLKNNNFPKGFRVLCHNCNSSLGYYGYCPHKKEE